MSGARRPFTSYAKVQKADPHPGLINLDFDWHPGVDVCWDLSRGLPFADASMRGVFSEHCLEHFPLGRARTLIAEVRRVMRPGAWFRVVVPDCELYLRTYVRALEGDRDARFPYPDSVPASLGLPAMYVNRVFYQDRESPHGHCVMYDYALLRALLLEQGFTRIERVAFREGHGPALLVDSEQRNQESLYVEALV